MTHPAFTPLPLLLAFSISCAPPSSNDDKPDATPDEDESAEPDLACTGNLNWRVSGVELPLAVDHHTTFVSDVTGSPYLYVLGGFDGSSNRAETWRASINADGNLAEFRAGPAMPHGISGHGLAVAGRRGFVLGGMTSSGASNQVFAFDIGDDGELGDFREVSPMPEARFHTTGVVMGNSPEGPPEGGNSVFAIGGVLGNGEAQPEVFVAELQADGLSAWSTAQTLSSARSHHASVVIDDTLYVLGGFFGNTFQNATTLEDDMLTARFDNGVLAPLTVHSADLGLDLRTHAATAADACILVFGGGRGDDFVANDQVYRVRLNANASPEVIATMPMALTHRHQVPRYGNVFYAVAGGINHHPHSEVFVGRFTAP